METAFYKRRSTLEEFLSDPAYSTIKVFIEEDNEDLKVFNLVQEAFESILLNLDKPDEIIEYIQDFKNRRLGHQYFLIQVYHISEEYFFTVLLCKISYALRDDKNELTENESQLIIIYKLIQNEFYPYKDGSLLSHRYFFVPSEDDDEFEGKINQQLTSDFNIAIYHDILKRYNGNYTPLKFLNQLKEAISVVGICYNDPILLERVLFTVNKEATYVDAQVIKDRLPFWLLIAIKNKIGFKNWIEEDISRESKLNLLFTHLNTCYVEANNGFAIDYSLYQFDCNGAKLVTDKKEGVQDNTEPVAYFQLWKGTKIDLIRVLNAMYELKFFEPLDKNQSLTKIDFMKKVGAFFSVDLSDYDSHLGQAFKTSSNIDKNIKVFQSMIDFTTSVILEKDGK